MIATSVKPQQNTRHDLGRGVAWGSQAIRCSWV